MQNLDLSIKHVMQTIIKQIVDVNKHVAAVMENKELDEADKNATSNFANYHLMVLSILLHDLADEAAKTFPDAKAVIDWSENNYKWALDNKLFSPCSCDDCKA